MVRIPIIALTADAFEEDRQRCLAVGMDDYLSKPVAIHALRAALLKWLPARIQDQVPETSTAVRSVDRQALAKTILEITPLLQENKFDAISCFRRVESLVAGTELEQEVANLSGLLRELKFDKVRDRLDVITNAICSER
jgi:DNA-binding response OmpR family regulator